MCRAARAGRRGRAQQPIVGGAGHIGRGGGGGRERAQRIEGPRCHRAAPLPGARWDVQLGVAEGGEIRQDIHQK